MYKFRRGEGLTENMESSTGTVKLALSTYLKLCVRNHQTMGMARNVLCMTFYSNTS